MHEATKLVLVPGHPLKSQKRQSLGSGSRRGSPGSEPLPRPAPSLPSPHPAPLPRPPAPRLPPPPGKWHRRTRVDNGGGSGSSGPPGSSDRVHEIRLRRRLDRHRCELRRRGDVGVAQRHPVHLDEILEEGLEASERGLRLLLHETKVYDPTERLHLAAAARCELQEALHTTLEAAGTLPSISSQFEYSAVPKFSISSGDGTN